MTSRTLSSFFLPTALGFSLIVLLAVCAGCGGSNATSSGSTPAPAPAPAPTPNATNQWTWMDGSNAASNPNSSNIQGVYSTSTGVQVGVYGTKGVGANGNIPGARDGATSWSDDNGNFWLFGGSGFDANGAIGMLNDLWEFSPSEKTWKWVSGSSVSNANGGQSGIYGIKNIGSVNNIPGGRLYALSWHDSQGNFWIFGGTGYDGNGNFGALNDLWEYSPAANTWAWVSGSNAADEIGQYGAINAASNTNVPGARGRSVGWIDSSNNLWIFGGRGYDSTDSNGPNGELNDLWKFNTATKNWTWMGGSSTTAGSGLGQPGVYGTQETPSASNIPGGRYHAVSWIDKSGNFWLFGGHGSDSTGAQDQLNDLWEFNPNTSQWKWVSGTNIEVTGGVYGTIGVASAQNFPGPREKAISWMDDSGNLWLFGGTGFDANGPAAFLNDLWKFSPSTNEWTWVSGSESAQNSSGSSGQFGDYGTLGTPAASNVPGGRFSTAFWTDTSDNLWLFGGQGFGASGAQGLLNDLWRYTP